MSAPVSRNLVAWIGVAVVVAVALLVGSPSDGPPPTPAERTYALARTIKCPQCVSQSVAESDVAISREIRLDIAARIEAGETDQQIRDAYVAAYGQDVLLSPPTSGSGAVVWVLPVLVLVAGVAGVVFVLRRDRAEGTATASSEDRDLVARALADRETGQEGT